MPVTDPSRQIYLFLTQFIISGSQFVVGPLLARRLCSRHSLPVPIQGQRLLTHPLQQFAQMIIAAHRGGILLQQFLEKASRRRRITYLRILQRQRMFDKRVIRVRQKKFF